MPIGDIMSSCYMLVRNFVAPLSHCARKHPRQFGFALTLPGVRLFPLSCTVSRGRCAFGEAGRGHSRRPWSWRRGNNAMKRILLGSTALVAAGVIAGGAQA